MHEYLEWVRSPVQVGGQYQDSACICNMICWSSRFSHLWRYILRAPPLVWDGNSGEVHGNWGRWISGGEIIWTAAPDLQMRLRKLPTGTRGSSLTRPCWKVRAPRQNSSPSLLSLATQSRSLLRQDFPFSATTCGERRHNPYCSALQQQQTKLYSISTGCKPPRQRAQKRRALHRPQQNAEEDAGLVGLLPDPDRHALGKSPSPCWICRTGGGALRNWTLERVQEKEDSLGNWSILHKLKLHSVSEYLFKDLNRHRWRVTCRFFVDYPALSLLKS